MSTRARLQRTGPYVLGGSMPVFEQFIRVAELNQARSSGPAVELTVAIMTIVQTMQENEETCQRLMTQLGKLVIVALKPWENRAEDDVSTDLRDNLSELLQCLESVLLMLEQIKNAPRWKAIFRGQDRVTKLGECQKLMDQAMASFQVDALIEGVSQLGAVDARDITVESVPRAQAAMSSTPALQHHSATLPRQDETLFGREAYIEALVVQLCYNKEPGEKNQPASTPPCLAILGAGSVGKTAVALVAVSDHRVSDIYQDRIHWIPCEGATSPELFVELVARSIGTPKGKGGDRKRDIIDFLRLTTHPRLLVFDNFETPWYIPARQHDIDNIIFDIASASSITILLTMRSDTLPFTRIQWTRPNLPPLTVLSLRAARELYLNIHKDAESDTSLDALLRELAYVPLAVRLMASRGSLGEIPSTLLALWKEEGVRARLLHQGDNHNSSVMISVDMSINSNLMHRNPEALTLLGVLAELPTGARQESLPDIAPTIVDLDGALRTLRQATLVKMYPSDQIIQLPPPIRSVVLQKYRAPPDLRALLLQAYIGLVRKYKSEPGDAIFLEAERILGPEGKNIETLLLDAVAFEPSNVSIDAAYDYASFQLVTSPRADLIENAVRAAHDRSQNGTLLSRGLVLAGKMYYALGRYADAVDRWEQALLVYKRIGDEIGQASCSQCLGSIYRMLGRYGEAVEAGKQALMAYQKIGDQLGEANTLYIIGEIYRALARYNDAVDVWKSAVDVYKRIGNQLGEANGLQGLGEVYRMLGKYGDAMDVGQHSLAAHRRVGSQLGEATTLHDLAEVYRMLGQYNEAVDQAERALLVYKKIDDELGQANSLQSLGNVYRKLGRYEEAVKVGVQALVLYKRTGSQLGEANTLQSLGQTRRMLGQYDDAVEGGKEALAVYQRIGSQLGEGISLNDLVENYRILGRYDDAVEAGNQALVVYKRIPDQLGQAAILANLGLTYQSQDRHEEAVQAIREAFAIFQRIQRGGEAERCRTLLRKMGVDPFFPSTPHQEDTTRSLSDSEPSIISFVDESFDASALHGPRDLPQSGSAPTQPAPPASKPKPPSDTPTDGWVEFLLCGQKTFAAFRKLDDTPYATGEYSDIWMAEVRYPDGKTETVAVKQLRHVGLSERAPVEALERMLARLTRETFVWMGVEHPNIVPLIGFTIRPPLILVSPWYEGGNIAAYLQRNPDADKLKLLHDIVRGLAYLHSRNPVVVHGDIKSDNVLIHDGSALLIDFGLSTIIEDASWYTKSHRQSGDMRWTAPELLLDENRDRSPATDVYSFGCLAFEIIVGLVPFHWASDMAVTTAIVVRRQKPAQDRATYPQLAGPIGNVIYACWADETRRPDMPQIERWISEIRKSI